VSSLYCFTSAVFRFCNRTAAARVGAGRSSPGVLRLGPPQIAAAVKVRAGGQVAGSSPAGGAVVVPLSGTYFEDEDKG
jgi:hypothetical protein